jgi:hypothetical protein
VVEHLPSKCKTLNSNPVPQIKRKDEEASADVETAAGYPGDVAKRIYESSQSK